MEGGTQVGGMQGGWRTGRVAQGGWHARRTAHRESGMQGRWGSAWGGRKERAACWRSTSLLSAARRSVKDGTWKHAVRICYDYLIATVNCNYIGTQPADTLPDTWSSHSIYPHCFKKHIPSLRHFQSIPEAGVGGEPWGWSAGALERGCRVAAAWNGCWVGQSAALGMAWGHRGAW